MNVRIDDSVTGEALVVSLHGRVDGANAPSFEAHAKRRLRNSGASSW